MMKSKRPNVEESKGDDAAQRLLDFPTFRLSTSIGQTGFTIVELLIATLVFSLILVVITAGVLSFSHSFYKGVTASNTQSTARTNIDDIAQAIQFSGQAVNTRLASNNGSEAFCIGDQRFSYLRGWQRENKLNVAAKQSPYVFVRDTVTGGCQGGTAQDLAAGGLTASSVELVQPHMRVARADIAAVSGDPTLYDVTLRIVYGDDDLLDNPNAVTAKCKFGLAGSQFCAVSQLHTVAQQRIN